MTRSEDSKATGEETKTDANKWKNNFLMAPYLRVNSCFFLFTFILSFCFFFLLSYSFLSLLFLSLFLLAVRDANVTCSDMFSSLVRYPRICWHAWGSSLRHLKRRARGRNSINFTPLSLPLSLKQLQNTVTEKE